MREVRVTEKMCWEPPPSKPWNDGERHSNQYRMWGKDQGAGKFRVQDDWEKDHFLQQLLSSSCATLMQQGAEAGLDEFPSGP